MRNLFIKLMQLLHSYIRIVPGSGENAICQIGNNAIGDKSSSFGDNTFAYGVGSHAEGKGSITKAGFTISGSGTSYTKSIPADLKLGSIIKYDNVIAKIVSTDTLTFTTDKVLSDSELSNAEVYIITGCAYGNNSHSSGTYCVASGENAHAEGSNTKAIGNNSCASGNFANAIGNRSQARGHYVETKNEDECAFGKNNLSHIKTTGSDDEKNAGSTLFSIGFGLGYGGNARRNTSEVMKNGDKYIYGIGGYDGMNFEEAHTLQKVLNMGCVTLNNGNPYRTHSDASDDAATVKYAGDLLIHTMLFWCTIANNQDIHMGKIEQSIYLDDGSYKCFQTLSTKGEIYKRTIGLANYSFDDKRFRVVTSVGEWVQQS